MLDTGADGVWSLVASAWKVLYAVQSDIDTRHDLTLRTGPTSARRRVCSEHVRTPAMSRPARSISPPAPSCWMRLFGARELHTTMAVITHNVVIGHLAERVLRFEEGAIVSDHRNQHQSAPRELRW